MKKEDIEPNVVYYTTNYDTLRKVIEKTDEIKDSDLLKEDFILRLSKYLINKTGMVLVTFKENKELNGCQIISKQRDKFGEFLWIDFSWIDPHYPNLGKIFDKEIVETCRAKGIKRIQARMSRGFKAMQRRYGAYEIAKIIERKVV